MNRVDFINEVNNSNLNFHDFNKIYKEFNYYQDEAYNTLLEFHKVCENNKINYELAFGSLLGMIRDGGQIPWDYDIDVIVPYMYKTKLVDSLKKDLNDDFYFYSIYNNKNCRHMIMRLAPKKFKTESLHVDVFFAIGTPNDDISRKELSNRIKKISFIRFYKKVKILNYSNGKIKTIIKLLLKKVQYSFTNLNKLMDEYDQLCTKYDITKSNKSIIADVSSGKTIFNSQDILKTCIIKDELGNNLRIPINYANILKCEYGNYEKLFPLEDRINEMMRHYKKLHKNNGNIYNNIKD